MLTRFLVLPNELWEHVFLQLDCISVLQCKKVCRVFNNIITASIEIQYREELMMDGMVDTCSSNLPIKERLALLRERRSAWDNLQWQIFPTQDIPTACDFYEFMGGTFAFIDEDQFTPITLPTKTPEGSRKTHQLDFTALDFAMDATQDVVIFLAEQIVNNPSTDLYVRTYNSLEPHPLSERPCIPVGFQERPPTCTVQIAGDILALVFNDADEIELYIRIWNWKSGRLIHEQALTNSGAKPDVFILLSAQAFALVFRTDSGYISIWNLDSGTEVSRLCLPEIIQNAELEEVTVDTPPLFARPQWPDRVFARSPDQRIQVFSLAYHSEEAAPLLQVHILNEFLLSYATPPPSSNQDPVSVRWDDWGPRNTRILNMGYSEDAHCFSNGLRVALPMGEDDSHLRVLDFNFRRKLAAKDPDTSKSSVKSITSPTIISYPEIFKKDVITCLPYTFHERAFQDSCPVYRPLIHLGEFHVLVVDVHGWEGANIAKSCYATKRTMGKRVPPTRLPQYFAVQAGRLLFEVCRLFNEIIASSSNIQNHERRSAWHELEWKLFPAQNFLKSYHAYRLVCGVFAVVQNNNEFITMTLPTKTSQGSQRVHHLDFDTRDFAMDPTQDLAIFLEERIGNELSTHLHIRTYETVVPHPDSEQPRIFVHLDERPDECLVQIAGDIFALAYDNFPTLLNGNETRFNIRIWNWKSGTLIHEQTLRNTGATPKSFVLLNSKAFALGVRTSSGYISIWDLDSGTEASRLHFPELSDLHDPEVCLGKVSVDAPPFLARPQSGCVFLTSPEHRVHTFSLGYEWHGVPWFDLRVHTLDDFLMSCATPRSSHSPERGPFLNVPWEDWGPHHTRIMEVSREPDDQSDQQYFSQGSRVLLPPDGGDMLVRVL
ncbi:hypothetical protein BDN72DRAFT_882672, partial [Pluteus cervinus]